MKNRILNKYINLFGQSISIERIFKHPLFSGSFFMIVGTNFANFIAYIYHLVFGRMLGPAQYGELATTISIIGLIMSFFSFFGTVIIKFVSSAKQEELPSVLGWFNSRVIKAAVFVSVIVWIVSPFFGNFTHLPKNITLLFAPLLFLSIISLVYKSFLQGVMRFREIAILSNIELFGRLAFGIVFIFFGMGVFGGVLGMLIAGTAGVILTKYFLKDIGFSKEKLDNFHWKKIISYALPVFIVSFSFTSLLTSDLILVKHFFSSYDAGIYGSVSNLGKIIFYGTAPIGAVMFPIISKKKSKGERFINIFIISVVLTVLLGMGVVVLYYLFPILTVSVLYGNGFLEASKYLVIMGIYYIFYSLAQLMSSFLLSIDMTKPLMILPVFAILQVVAIYIFHTSFSVVITSSMASVSLLLMYLGLYFAYAKRKSGK